MSVCTADCSELRCCPFRDTSAAGLKAARSTSARSVYHNKHCHDPLWTRIESEGRTYPPEGRRREAPATLYTPSQHCAPAGPTSGSCRGFEPAKRSARGPAAEPGSWQFVVFFTVLGARRMSEFGEFPGSLVARVLTFASGTDEAVVRAAKSLHLKEQEELISECEAECQVGLFVMPRLV